MKANTLAASGNSRGLEELYLCEGGKSYMAGMFGDNPLVVLVAVGLVMIAVIAFALMTAGF
jgi:hypothetical protein